MKNTSTKVLLLIKEMQSIFRYIGLKELHGEHYIRLLFRESSIVAYIMLLYILGTLESLIYTIGVLQTLLDGIRKWDGISL
jgi:hypothetical protein